MIYVEGYRGFHRQFSPRVVVRGLHLAAAPTPVTALLAPFMCMGLLRATRKRLAVSWGLVAMIVLLVVGRYSRRAGVVVGGAATGLSLPLVFVTAHTLLFALPVTCAAMAAWSWRRKAE